jgi:predicted metal-binding protein
MTSPDSKDYIVIVQCHIAMTRCSGYGCEQSFSTRTGGFAIYPKDKPYRTLYLTCGGCCGRGVQAKLANLLRRIKKKEGIDNDRVAVQLSSCITKDSHHGPGCPHRDYLRTIIGRLGLDIFEDTIISQISETRRREGQYAK